jgi:UV DNA damage endonuclease
MPRLGLCCKFAAEPIRFRDTTALALGRLGAAERRRKLEGICADNAAALKLSIEYCAAHGIGDFRVSSRLLPLATHPDCGYAPESLPAAVKRAYKACGLLAARLGVRLTFHPDQFILLSSPDPAVNAASARELDYQARAAAWIGADVINIHAGGVYGDKKAALKRLAAALAKLPARVLERLTLENDDRLYTPADLLPFCREHGLPLVYDVHHHRCAPDGLSVEQATAAALRTWRREPLFHLSSPREGWRGADPRPHHDYIDFKDFPACWRGLDITVEVEAKAKELAIARLKAELERAGGRGGKK